MPLTTLVPPLFALATGVGMSAASTHLSPSLSLASLAPETVPYAPYAAGALASVGLGFALRALLAFPSYEVSITPMVPSRGSRLVTSGIYAYSRNPWYLGLASLLAAWGTYLGSPLAAVAGVSAFIGGTTAWIIVPEENELRRIFPVEYPEYTRRVRRWI
jgi:protein-S-isoprenylcysteine O-methyltransferase Ste14